MRAMYVIRTVQFWDSFNEGRRVRVMWVMSKSECTHGDLEVLRQVIYYGMS